MQHPDCNDGGGSCDSSKLTQAEAGVVRAARHQRNAADCRDGMGLCDPSQLTTQAQAKDAEFAEHQRNATNCRNGWNDCNHSKLTVLEARDVKVEEHQRNLSDCKAGREPVNTRNRLGRKLLPWPTPSTRETIRPALKAPDIAIALDLHLQSRKPPRTSLQLRDEAASSRRSSGISFAEQSTGRLTRLIAQADSLLA